MLNARPPNEHTREPHSQPRTPIRRIWLITLSNTNPIELQGIVGNKTLHTLATYRRLCIYHTPSNSIGISSSSVIVIIQGDVSVQFLIIMCFIYPDIYLFRHLRNFLGIYWLLAIGKSKGGESFAPRLLLHVAGTSNNPACDLGLNPDSDARRQIQQGEARAHRPVLRYHEQQVSVPMPCRGSRMFSVTDTYLICGSVLSCCMM